MEKKLFEQLLFDSIFNEVKIKFHHYNRLHISEFESILENSSFYVLYCGPSDKKMSKLTSDDLIYVKPKKLSKLILDYYPNIEYTTNNDLKFYKITCNIYLNNMKTSFTFYTVPEALLSRYQLEETLNEWK